MALVNIPRDRDDPNYRYKMPKLMSKIEGRGNGIRTNIFNMGDIARSLKRPPMYPTKFFGCELGAMVKFEEAEEKALISGAHNEQDLVQILDKFIQMYVLCTGCDLPEMDIIVKKGILTCKCNACGYLGTLDNAHKAATYMVRNPPNSAETTVGKKKKTKEERRAEKLAEKADKGDKGSREKKSKKSKKKGPDEGNEDESSSGKVPEESGDATPTNEGDEGWDEEKLSDSEKKRDKKKEKKERKLAAAEKKLMQKEALTFDSPEIADVCDRLRSILENNEGVNVDAFFTELRMLQVSQDFDAKCRMYVVLSTLFNDGLSPEALEAKMPFIAKCCDSSVQADDVLEALEYFCGNNDSTSFTGYPYLLQKLYSAEVLEADEILKHYTSETNESLYEKCKKHAEPFLEWLAADDESSDDE